MRIRFQDVRFRFARSSAWVITHFEWEAPGDRTVLLGPNGAGKSTILALSASALRPTSGRISLGELTPSRKQLASYRRAVGWMPQHVRPVPGLTVREQVAYAGWLKGLSTNEAWAAAELTLQNVLLSPLKDRKATTLSGGQLRRLGLAQVLVHQPTLVLLDEPTAGLDPAQRIQFREVVGMLPRSVSVIISTHQMSDVDGLFDSVAVIDRGRLCFSGPQEAFMKLGDRANPASAEQIYASLVEREI